MLNALIKILENAIPTIARLLPDLESQTRHNDSKNIGKRIDINVTNR